LLSVIHTAGHLLRYGRLLGSNGSRSPLSLIVLMTGPLNLPPVSSRSYFLASLSSSFLIEAPEWTPLSLALSRRTSFAILAATLSSVVIFLLSLDAVDCQSAYEPATRFFSSAILLFIDILEALLAPDLYE
jgi:hypothetical protein